MLFYFIPEFYFILLHMKPHILKHNAQHGHCNCIKHHRLPLNFIQTLTVRFISRRSVITGPTLKYVQ